MDVSTDAVVENLMVGAIYPSFLDYCGFVFSLIRY